MKMKKILALLLCVVMLFALCACGEGGEDGGEIALCCLCPQGQPADKGQQKNCRRYRQIPRGETQIIG